MRWHEITEAPLADFDAYGDMDKGGSFRPEDLRAIRSPKWRAKVYRAFAKTPYLFNIYLYNGEDGVAPVGHGHGFQNDPLKVNDLSNLKKYAGVQSLRAVANVIGKTPPNAAASITVLLVENEGAGRVALTPWILGHRVGHAILESGSAMGEAADLTRARRAMFEVMNWLVNDMERLFSQSAKHRDAMADDFASTSDRISSVARLIATFRSGRSGNFTNGSEFYVELFTQYLLQGAVRFERPEMDSAGRTVPRTDLDPALLALGREHRNDREAFTNAALRLKYKYKTAPRRPTESYTAFDAGGTAVAAFGADRVAQYRERGYRVEKTSPSKQEIARWTTYRQRWTEFQELWTGWDEDGLLAEPRPSATDHSDRILTEYEATINNAIAALLDACVGKAVVL